MKRKTSDVPSRIWKYNLPFGPDPEDEARVEEQIRHARVYRNALIAIEREKRDRYRKAREQLVPGYTKAQEDYDEVDALVAAINKKIKQRRQATRKRVDVSDLSAQKKILVEERKQLKAVRDALRNKAKEDPALIEAVKDIDQWENAKIKEAWARSEAAWGTKLRVVDAFSRSKRSSSDPEFKTWHTVVSPQGGRSLGGEGTVAVQIQATKRLHTASLTACKDTRLRLEVGTQRGRPNVSCKRPAEQKARLWLRVGSDGRKPIWAKFDLVYHRPLPPDAEIKGCWVQRKRVGPGFRWEACFQIESRSFDVPKRLPSNRCGINLGWRKLDDMRVAYVVGTDGHKEQVSCPKKTIEWFRKAREIDEIRSRNMNAARDALLAGIASLGDQPPSWFVEHSKTLSKWRSPRRLAALIYRWRDERFDGDSDIFVPALEWAKQDRHLHQMVEGMRRRARNRRKYHYRLIAKLICERYSNIVLDGVDLAELAKRKEPGEELEQAQRRQRFELAPSEFKDAIMLAASNGGCHVDNLKEMRYGTMTCHVCSELCAIDRSELMQTCEHCGAQWDQDENHCRNLLAFSASEAAE